MKIIKLTKGCETIVDDEDYVLINSFKWHVCAGYASRYLPSKPGHKRQRISVHAMLLKAVRPLEIDHINRDRLDNRKANLRIVTRSENMKNKDRSLYTRSKLFRGTVYKSGGRYSKTKRKTVFRWRFVIYFQRKAHWKTFKTKTEALAYKRNYKIN